MILGRRERAFILGSLFYRELPLERLRELAGRGLGWGALAAAAGRAGLGPVVANAVMEAGVHAELPRRVGERLLGELHRNTAQNAAVVALLARAAGHLRDAGVDALPIKGAALLLEDEALVQLRHLDDLDLLVRPVDVDRAAEVLLAAGWRLDAAGLTVGGQPVAGPGGLGRVHHGVTLRGPTNLVLELHHALPSVRGRPRDAGEGVFERARSLSWRRQVVRCPGREDLLVIATEHVLVHHREELVHLPRLILDVHALILGGADPRAAASLGEAGRAGSVERGLALLAEARRLTMAPTVLGRSRPERPLSWLWSVTNEVGLVMRKVAKAPRTFSRALQAHGWRAVLPARSYMASRYGVEEHSPLMPLLYVWRPIRGAFRMIVRR